GEWVTEKVKKHYQGNFDVVSNPEFLREGSAVQDFLDPDRIVFGVESKKAEEIMLDIYSSIDAPKVVTDIKSAELVKYAANAFLGTKISFINEIANICERAGGDVEEVAKGIGLDDRIGPKFLNAGIGYGGNCFPKDIDALRNFSKDAEYNFKLLEAVVKVNKQQKLQFAQRIKEALKETEGEKVGIWGLAFKPNTDDVRKAPSLEIIKELQQNGYKIKTYDPQAIPNAKEKISSEKIEYCQSPIEAAKGVSVLALVTEWPEFSELDMGKVKEVMQAPYLLDGRNFFDPKQMGSIGFKYQGIGKYE
ncbi:MAG: UDP-glucose dehydrogenase family protein, partial [Elusimicrobiota bacterium]